MSHHVGRLHGRSVGGKQIFPARSRANFASSYPEGAHKLEHDLIEHPLLELDALANAVGTAAEDHDRAEGRGMRSEGRVRRGI